MRARSGSCLVLPRPERSEVRCELRALGVRQSTDVRLELSADVSVRRGQKLPVDAFVEGAAHELTPRDNRLTVQVMPKKPSLARAR
ncbi:MAG TPA: hypothetical protein VK447_04475, partial [Myxococcaceae bacterium]|nr:hypothetical protein [Myxococcaceae bacterium]